MSGFMERLRKGYGRKLISLHIWNGWIVVILALTGLVLIGGYWRGVLGEGRVWLKGLHIVVGIASIIPVIYYLALAGKHWKQLKTKPWQRFNVLFVLGLLLGWFISGVLLWQIKAVGPSVANVSLIVHDLLTWIGLPYIIYHSITRAKWLKEPSRRTVQAEQVVDASDAGPSGRTNPEDVSQTRPKFGPHPGSRPESGSRPQIQPRETPQPIYTRRSFIRGAIGVGLAVTLGPSFVKWLGTSVGNIGGGQALDELIENNANQMVPDPIPLPSSSPPIGGGAQGEFRVYTVTPIPSFSNDNWSFTIDGLVDKSFQWNWEQFVALKRTVQVSDFHCVTGWSVYKNTWEGIKLKDLLQMAGVKQNAKNVKLYSGDGVYTSTLSIEQANLDDVMVTVMHDGKEIPNDLGGPVRLVVPKMYAYKSVKWLNRIELIEGDHIGYWESRGYSNDAWI